jgi:hypothetical protein
VRLVIANFSAGKGPHTRNAIGKGAAIKFVECRPLPFFGSDDQLSADLVRDGVGFTKAHHLCRTFDAELRLERPGTIINARVDNTTVVTSLVDRQLRFFLQYEHAKVWISGGKFFRRGQPNNSGSYYRNIKCTVQMGSA